MDIDESEQLANEIDAHCIALLRGRDSKERGVSWMTKAFNLLEKCSKDLRRPRMFAVHNGFGCATYTLERPSGLIIHKKELSRNPPIWFEGKTITYGDRYQNRTLPWTPKDGRKLVAENERKKNAENESKKIQIVRKGK